MAYFKTLLLPQQHLRNVIIAECFCKETGNKSFLRKRYQGGTQKPLLRWITAHSEQLQETTAR